jgi:hypothetical protein
MVSKHRLERTLLSIGIGLFGAVVLFGQGAIPSNSVFGALPSAVTPLVAALGERAHVSGQERTIFVGQYVDASGNRPARVTYQIPGLVQLDGFRPGSARVTFDGERSYGVVTRLDDAFLETFVMDTTEGMLVSARRGAGMRLLGRHFLPNPKNFQRYTGPRYDIFEVIAPVRSRNDQLVRLKRYYFDSRTGLLIRTRYRDLTTTPTVTVETRFTGWRNLDGSAYPERIDRYENGRPIFSFVVTNISLGPRVEAAEFR